MHIDFPSVTGTGICRGRRRRLVHRSSPPKKSVGVEHFCWRPNGCLPSGGAIPDSIPVALLDTRLVARCMGSYNKDHLKDSDCSWDNPGLPVAGDLMTEPLKDLNRRVCIPFLERPRCPGSTAHFSGAAPTAWIRLSPLDLKRAKIADSDCMPYRTMIIPRPAGGQFVAVGQLPAIAGTDSDLGVAVRAGGQHDGDDTVAVALPGLSSSFARVTVPPVSMKTPVKDTRTCWYAPPRQGAGAGRAANITAVLVPMESCPVRHSSSSRRTKWPDSGSMPMENVTGSSQGPSPRLLLPSTRYWWLMLSVNVPFTCLESGVRTNGISTRHDYTLTTRDEGRLPFISRATALVALSPLPPESAKLISTPRERVSVWRWTSVSRDLHSRALTTPV